MSKLSVYEVYGQDKEYQSFMGEFNKKKWLLEEMARQGTYSKEHLREVSKHLHSQLQNFMSGHKDKRCNERAERMKEIKSKTNKIGYVERKDEAKELEMRFRLANDFELKRMVDELDSTDLLELNLLRMELKSRGLDKNDVSGQNSDAKVKQHIIKNNLEGMSPDDQKEHDRLQEETNIYFSMGSSFIVGEDSFTTLETVKGELDKAVNTIPDKQSAERSVNLERFNL
ncbi:hypothetical protein [Pseudalkalibacillus decolorationis]|uniref:hypothetical protein n=1 Tax=Pseudalkalibacillus decolorationis TaxID=163879 RepID=UPI00214768BD|nr:hypothetical protein [Pseudalkalibacillus decolorationis]